MNYSSLCIFGKKHLPPPLKDWQTKIPLNALQTFQLLRFATTLFIGILLAKFFQLPTVDIALYEVLLFLGNFLTFFWISAGIKSLLSQFSKEEEQGALVVNIALLLTLLGVLAAAVLYFCQAFIVQRFTQFENIEHIGLISLFLIFNVPAALIEYIYLLQKKEKAILWYGGVIFSTQLLVIVLPLTFNWGLAGIFQGLVLWAILKFIWLLKLLLSIHNPSAKWFDWTQQKTILSLMFPLSLHMLIGGGMEYVDGFIVTSYFTDNSTFAIFRYGARELPLVTILASALTATLIPLAVENQSLAIPKIRKEVDKIANWLFPITMVLMLTSPYIFPFVYNESFAQSARVFNVYLLIISSRLLLPQVIIYAQRHNFVLVWTAVIEVFINLGLSFYLVRDYGLEGIAFATVIAYLVNKLILIGYNYFTFKIPLTDYLNIPRFLVLNGVLSFIFWMSL